MLELRQSTRGGRLRWLFVLLAMGLIVSACGSGGSAESKGDRFTFAISAQPNLNPYLADGNPYNQWVLALAYEPLIRRSPDLSYAGGLAESFRYTDDENKVFELTLREGLKFADGTAVDAEAVKASLDYFLEAGINAKTWGSTIESVEATGPLTVVVNNSRPNPDMPFVLSQTSLAGLIISPAGLADPDKLGQSTFGAGPYVLDEDASVSGSRYVFSPNPNYWNAEAVHWEQVVAMEIADPNSSVKALKAGQVDYIGSAVNLLPEIEAAGLDFFTYPAGVVGVSLADRDGVASPELKDQRVRQALNHAIDREAILETLFAGYGKPTTQLNSDGYEGYDADSEDRYPYDLDRARQLLEEAGYGDGFTVKMVAQKYIGQDVLAQAVASQWEKIGVKVEMTTEAQIPQAIAKAMTREFAVTPFLALNSSAYLLSTNTLAPVPNPGNPFGTQDAALSDLLGSAAAIGDPEVRDKTYREAIARVVDLAWFAPVVTIDGVSAASSKITGWKGNFFDPTLVEPA